MRSCHSRHIESLAGSHERNGIVLCPFGNHGKRYMSVRRQRQVGMNLIRKDNDIILRTDIGYSFQLLVRPDYSTRIVRIAQNKYAHALNLPAEQIQIHPVLAVFQYQRTLHQTAVITGYQPREWRIHRRHDHNLVTRMSESIDRHSQSRYNARYVSNLFLFYLHAITSIHPVDYRPIITVRLACIAQYRMFTTFFYRIEHKRRCSKIHICHPHGDKVCPSPDILHSFYFFRIRTSPVYRFIKIIIHGNSALN